METGLTRCKEVWMCGFQGTRNRRRSAYCAESFQDGGFGYKVTKLKPRKRRTAQTLHRFPVIMAKGIHLFPYRTQKLSLSAPMVLGWRRPGRVGRCRIPQRKASDECLGLFLCVSGEILLSDHLRRSQRTYLVRIFPAARSAGCRQKKSPGRAELCLIFVASFRNSCYNVGTRYPQRKR